MIAFVTVLGRFFRAIWRGLGDPAFRALAIMVAIVVGSGTVFYRQVEDWSWLDSFYFTIITLTTVGYGDLSPTTPGSKIFTVAYLIVGIGLLLTFVERVASHAVEGSRWSPGDTADS